MKRIVLASFLVALMQGCCLSNCANNFARTSKVLFGEQIEESLENAPKSLYNIGQLLKGNKRSFMRTGGFAYETAKGNAKSIAVTGRMVREQWNESIEGIPRTLKIFGEFYCLYCEEDKKNK